MVMVTGEGSEWIWVNRCRLSLLINLTLCPPC